MLTLTLQSWRPDDGSRQRKRSAVASWNWCAPARRSAFDRASSLRRITSRSPTPSCSDRTNAREERSAEMSEPESNAQHINVSEIGDLLHAGTKETLPDFAGRFAGDVPIADATANLRTLDTAIYEFS